MLLTKKETKKLKREWKRFAKAHPLTAPLLVPFHTQALTSGPSRPASGFPTPRAWGGEPGAGKSAILMLDDATRADMAEFQRQYEKLNA